MAIVAGGTSRFGVRNLTWRELLQEAAAATFDAESRILPKEIDTLVVGAAEPERFAFQSYVAPLAAETLGMTPKMLLRTELACASGQMALRTAWAHIASGLCDVALVAGVEKMNLPNMAETQASMACVLDREWEGLHGASAPPFFAMCAQRHMHSYGTTVEQMAKVVEKNHHYSTFNPTAHFTKEVPMDKVLRSPMVAPPLRLFDCSGITDGAAIAILAREAIVPDLTDTPLWVHGWGQANQGFRTGAIGDLASWPAMSLAAREAYRNARVSPKDLDVVELHDCFSISEIIAYEQLGFTPEGKGGAFIDEGQSYIGGSTPINTRGGLLGCGHPLGATGVAQVVELFRTLRSEVPPQRQVSGATLAMAHNLSGNANTHSIGIYGLDKPGTAA